MQVAADVRLITSTTFASHYSLRFPRVQRIRWDKNAPDIQTQSDLETQLEQNRYEKGEDLCGSPFPVDQVPCMLCGAVKPGLTPVILAAD